VRAEHAHLVEQGARLVELRLDYLRGDVTLKRLIAVGIATGETLKPDRLDALFMLIKTLPAYELAFSDIENAEKCLKDILSH